MQKKYRVAGYVKLAKKWEKREKQAIEYNNAYYGSRSARRRVLSLRITDYFYLMWSYIPSPKPA